MSTALRSEANLCRCLDCGASHCYPISGCDSACCNNHAAVEPAVLVLTAGDLLALIIDERYDTARAEEVRS